MSKAILAVLLLFVTALASAQAPIPRIEDKTKGWQKQPGYIPFYWDERGGKLWLEISRLNQEFLYVNSLPTGLGSNDIGLDRGQLGRTRIVRFDRIGPKLLLVQPNYSFRALSDNPDERRAVRESFAESVLWGFTIEGEQDGRVLVDATSFFLRDAHGVTERLEQGRQGNYRPDASRSALHLERTKNFPRNTEVEVTLTFGGEPRGAFVREVSPSPDSVTLRQHHSFIELPEPGYRPRAMDPRAGYMDLQLYDYASPVGEPIRKQWIRRHRLNKKDPSAAVSDAVKPIIYYLDRGAPEPIRSALLEGARWWNQAFEAAGYRNAYRVEMMPEGADSMDIRYNVIQWVHRSTRGWSYGSTVTDPRTGEILKGHVTLGSLRVRQDYLIAEGLLAPYEEGQEPTKAMLEMSLSRLRQLSAHEVGHTLGLMHNYVSSAHDRASVMDYPHPVIQLSGEGTPQLAGAYAEGVGEWDKVAIGYGYQDFGGAAEAPRLSAILDAAHKRGLYFIADDDSRPPGSAHPQSHLWDNGADATGELKRILEVRARALARFSEKNIPIGRPMSTLEGPLVTTYLLHRYQTEAAAKVLGGLYYTYALRGDGQLVTRAVPAADQRKALDAVLATIQPDTLTLPERILAMLPPAAHGYDRTREYFRSRTGVTFDAVAAAEAAASHSIGLLLHPERAGRLVQYHARDARAPGLGEVIDKLIAATWRRAPVRGLAQEAGRAADHVALHHLMALSANDAAGVSVRAIATQKIEQLRAWLASQGSVTTDPDQKAHFAYAVEQIKKFREDPKPASLPRLAEPPPGMPIGMLDCGGPFIRRQEIDILRKPWHQ